MRTYTEFIRMCVHTYACTHAHTHTYEHLHVRHKLTYHAYTHTRALLSLCVQMYSLYARVYICRHMYSCSCTHTFAVHAFIYRSLYACVYIRTHTRTHTFAFPAWKKCIHTYTCSSGIMRTHVECHGHSYRVDDLMPMPTGLE